MSSTNDNELPYHQSVHIAGLIHKSRERLSLTTVEQQELETWLNDEEDNRQLFESLHNRKQLMDELQVVMQYDADSATQQIFNAIGQQPERKVYRRLFDSRWVAAAAVLLLLVGITWHFTRQWSADNAVASSKAPIRDGRKAVLTLSNGEQVELDTLGIRYLGRQGAALLQQQGPQLSYKMEGDGLVAYNTVTTPPGVQYQLALADGSEVWLNGASSIRYPTAFTGNSRDVVMTGEAYFSVAKNKAMPFFVTAGEMKVQVVGTQFNVMAYSDEDAIRTTLVEGVVKVIPAGRQKSNRQLVLKPGEQATLLHGYGTLFVEKPNLDEVTGWRKGAFSFRDTDMMEIMRQVARWYNVKMKYRGTIKGIGFSGQISRKEQMRDLLDILSDTRKVHFEIRDDSTVVVIPGSK